MLALAKELEGSVAVQCYSNAAELNAGLLALLLEGDLILVKSSGGSGLSTTVELLWQ